MSEQDRSDEARTEAGRPVGSPDMRLPDALRAPLLEHLEQLRRAFAARQWGGRVGFGERPAVVVIDLAPFWTDPSRQIGSHVAPLIEATCRVLVAARAAGIPVFFTTYAYDPATPPSPHDRKQVVHVTDASLFELEPRLGRRPSEKLIRKPYASAFKGTNFHEMLTALGVDPLVVCGMSTSHCVYATCRDATDSFRVIVAREAVGERCELLHEVNMLDIDVDLGDVVPVDEVIRYLRTRSSQASC